MKNYKKKSIELAKKQVRDEAEFCVKCGSPTNQLHAHHVVPVRYGHTSAYKPNIIPICASCHTLGMDAAHQHPHQFQRWFDTQYPGLYDELWEKAQSTDKIDWEEIYKSLVLS